jgi:hypothetical protein
MYGQLVESLWRQFQHETDPQLRVIRYQLAQCVEKYVQLTRDPGEPGTGPDAFNQQMKLIGNSLAV